MGIVVFNVPLDTSSFRRRKNDLERPWEVCKRDRRVYQWRRYTRALQVKWPGWKIHLPGSALPSPACCFVSVIVWTENKNVTISDRFICFILTVKRAFAACVLRATIKKRSSTFFEKKVYTGDLAGWFSDLEMSWLLYCVGAATDVYNGLRKPRWTLSRTNWRHFCLTLTRISASAAPANLGYISVLIIIIVITVILKIGCSHLACRMQSCAIIDAFSQIHPVDADYHHGRPLTFYRDTALL